MDQLIDKAATLLEALPYMQRFRGETFVIKYGGSFMDSTDSAVRGGGIAGTTTREKSGMVSPPNRSVWQTR